mgnify:FL=1
MTDFILFIASLIALLAIFATAFIIFSLPLYLGWNLLAFMFGFKPISFMWAFICTNIIIMVRHMYKF